MAGLGLELENVVENGYLVVGSLNFSCGSACSCLNFWHVEKVWIAVVCDLGFGILIIKMQC